MIGVIVQGAGGSDLHDLPEVHHGHPVADVFHDRQVMGNEEHGQVELVLEIAQEVDDLGLDGDVEG